jgi:hypothetical protein
VFCNHIITSSIAAIVSGILVDNAKAAGEPALVTDLMGAAGDVLSASYSQELYEIAKLLRGNPAVSAAFDAGDRRPRGALEFDAGSCGVQQGLCRVHCAPWPSRSQRLGDIVENMGEHA